MSVRSDNDEWDIARFERWLRIGVESYVLEDAGLIAFPEAAHLILRTGSLTAGLRAFADGLNAVRRDNLKQALAQVLSSLEQQERFVPVAENLLAIAVAISAYPVLNVLAFKIGNGFFGQQVPEDRNSLFAMAIYSVARLATPGREDAKHCLHELIGSVNFQPAHAGTALIALCQIDPRGLAEHLSIPGLRTKLKEQINSYDQDGRLQLQNQIARQIYESIGLENLINALPRLAALDPSGAENAPDDWLLDELIYNNDAPLKIQSQDQTLRVCHRNNPDNFIEINDSVDISRTDRKIKEACKHKSLFSVCQKKKRPFSPNLFTRTGGYTSYCEMTKSLRISNTSQPHLPIPPVVRSLPKSELPQADIPQLVNDTKIQMDYLFPIKNRLAQRERHDVISK